MRLLLSIAVVSLGVATCGRPVLAFDIVGRWTQTQASGGGLQRGDAITLSWSLVPDGRSYDRSNNSNLIDYLDDGWNVPQAQRTADFTNRPWWTVINSAYEQYERVSGLTLVYIPEQNASGQSTGMFGDMRIGGEVIDNNPGGVLADNTFPNGGDMRIDTSRDGNGNPSGAHSNPAPLRNLISHESGHGVGLGHSDIAGAESVMEGGLQDHFYGLQFDDVFAFNRLYGDPLEKNGGNDTYMTATNLGSFSTRATIARGTDAIDSTVEELDDDWAGIDGSTDEDWFRFQVTRPGAIDLKLTPVGPTYQMAGQTFNAAAQSDLRFELYDPAGTLIRTSDFTGLGQAEEFRSQPLFDIGEYRIRVAGDRDNNQFYQLDANIEMADLLLTINRDTGEAYLSGMTAAGGGFDGYRIESSRSELNPANGAWLSLADQQNGEWREANPTTSSLQELLPTGTTTLTSSDSIYLGKFYTPSAGEPFGTVHQDDLTFQYLTPGTGNQWLTGAIAYTGSPMYNNLVLTIDPATGAATVTNDSSTAISLDGYSLSSDADSLDSVNWNSFADQNFADWRESGPGPAALSELKPTGGTTIEPGQVLSLGRPFVSLAEQDVEFGFLLNGDAAFRPGIVEYDTILGPNGGEMTLAVDPVSGEAILTNTSDFALHLDGYSISSDSGSLNIDGWESLDYQLPLDWIASNPTPFALSELKPEGAMAIQPGESFSLGFLFDPLGTADLEIGFLLLGDGQFRPGVVEYQTLGMPGDYNRDGSVNAADYAVWKQSYGSTQQLLADGNNDGVVNLADYTIWRDHLSAAGSVSASAMVPEPSSAWIGMLAAAGLLGFRLRWTSHSAGSPRLQSAAS